VTNVTAQVYGTGNNKYAINQWCK